MVRFKVLNGKWLIGNLNDSLTMHDFNRFIRMHKEIRLELRKTKRQATREFKIANQHKYKDVVYR